jgi:hypothetical protein
VARRTELLAARKAATTYVRPRASGDVRACHVFALLAVPERDLR